MKSTQQYLTPSQKAVKHPRRIIYGGSKQNCDPELGRDIIVLYVQCGLGYSPIRHIIGAKNDKIIENVVRQHMLGRNKVNFESGELLCPGSKYISNLNHKIIEHMVSKYGTGDDPYIKHMLIHNKWSDDPVVYIKKCPSCGKKVESDWKACPHCMTILIPTAAN